MDLIFGTSNQNKWKEVQALLPPGIRLKTAAEVGFHRTIEEPYSTIAENSEHKARVLYNEIATASFAEDSGLCVNALNGAPGVLSARYASEKATDAENVQKLLNEMKGIGRREASFLTIISFIHNNELFQFEGKVEGTIALEARGRNGFGYDPVFIPLGYDKTFAELDASVKNKVSHRARALEKFLHFLGEHLPSFE